MHILRQLPFRDVEYTVAVAGQSVRIRAYQVLVWVSLSAHDVLAKDVRQFPAVLDTGHSHNFSILDNQLRTWVGMGEEVLPRLGSIVVNRQEVPLQAGNLWIHRNRPGTGELLPRPFRLDIPQGIAVYSEAIPGAPRLPLLGLRGLVRSKLRLTLDGEKMVVSLRT